MTLCSVRVSSYITDGNGLLPLGRQFYLSHGAYVHYYCFWFFFRSDSHCRDPERTLWYTEIIFRSFEPEQNLQFFHKLHRQDKEQPVFPRRTQCHIGGISVLPELKKGKVTTLSIFLHDEEIRRLCLVLVHRYISFKASYLQMLKCRG